MKTAFKIFTYTVSFFIGVCVTALSYHYSSDTSDTDKSPLKSSKNRPKEVIFTYDGQEFEVMRTTYHDIVLISDGLNNTFVHLDTCDNPTHEREPSN